MGAAQVNGIEGVGAVSSEFAMAVERCGKVPRWPSKRANSTQMGICKVRMNQLD